MWDTDGNYQKATSWQDTKAAEVVVVVVIGMGSFYDEAMTAEIIT